nr:hypothetical protein [Tanacetum cinerariifolium]
MYCFINNIHVDYTELLWEGIHYSLHQSTSSIPYTRFKKITIGHYMTNFLEISRHARDKYHNLKDDDLMKNIFYTGRYKDKVFGIDVPLTQSQPTKSIQRTYRTPSTPSSTRLTPPAPVPTVDKADELILQDTLQDNRMSLMIVQSLGMMNTIFSTLEEEDDEITDEVYELKRSEKETNVEESRITPFPTPIRSLRNHTDLVSSDTEKL